MQNLVEDAFAIKERIMNMDKQLPKHLRDAQKIGKKKLVRELREAHIEKLKKQKKKVKRKALSKAISRLEKLKLKSPGKKRRIKRAEKVVQRRINAANK